MYSTSTAYFFMFSSLLITKFVVSINLSTQLEKQASVRESIRAPILSKHLSQHRSVKVCTLAWNLRKWLCAVEYKHTGDSSFKI